ncbi:SagB/ThcOx family dehydrogenase [Streptomyces sp. NPDC054796]
MTGRSLYRRNPDLLLEWDEDAGAVLVDCLRWRKFSAKAPLVDLLHHLDGPLSAEEAHARWQGAEDAEDTGDTAGVEGTRKLLVRLAAAGIVQRCDKEDEEEGEEGDGAPVRGRGSGLTRYELAAHAQAGRGPVPHARQGPPPPARLRHPGATATVPLAEDAGPPSRPLSQVLEQRRSVREFAPEPVPLALVAAVLDRSARVRGYLPPRAYEQTQRAAPSGGGRHSLEVYLLARDVGGLDSGAYHYDPFAHALHRLSPWSDGLSDLQDRVLTTPALMAAPPPAGLYLTSRAARTGWKYEGMALSLIYRDTGCLMQTMCLAATDLGLASCLTGRMEAPPTAPFLPPDEHDVLHVGNLALGLPSASPTVPLPMPEADG